MSEGKTEKPLAHEVIVELVDNTLRHIPRHPSRGDIRHIAKIETCLEILDEMRMSEPHRLWVIRKIIGMTPHVSHGGRNKVHAVFADFLRNNQPQEPPTEPAAPTA